jgi:hypothetical protein
MATKVSQTALWVLMHSLPWSQHKKLVPIVLMGCVHTHKGKPTIEGCGNLSHTQSDVEKIGEDNQKVGKIGQTISQVPAPSPKHDKIQAQLVSNIPSKSMLERV